MIPLAGTEPVTLAQIEALYTIWVGWKLQRDGNQHVTVRVSKATDRRYLWCLSVSAGSVRALEKRGLVRTRLQGARPYYVTDAFLTDAGHAALKGRESALEAAAAEVIQCSAECNARNARSA